MTAAELQLRAARAALAAAFRLVEEAPSLAGQVVISPAAALGWNLKHMAAISDALKAEDALTPDIDTAIAARKLEAEQ